MNGIFLNNQSNDNDFLNAREMMKNVGKQWLLSHGDALLMRESHNLELGLKAFTEVTGRPAGWNAVMIEVMAYTMSMMFARDPSLLMKPAIQELNGLVMAIRNDMEKRRDEVIKRSSPWLSPDSLDNTTKKA